MGDLLDSGNTAKPQEQPSIILRDVSFPSKQERIQLFKETEALVKKYHDYQEVLSMQKKLNLNETNVVLLETLRDFKKPPKRKSVTESPHRTKQSPVRSSPKQPLVAKSERISKSMVVTPRVYTPVRRRRSTRKSVN
ncbi:uncharacterized protein LOC130657426 [Hydractinia symbiolongicarpus]|uniref:uncharacterized protein LOC130657426 n=1 Tax=Hydractinia symbiolongicarpus TaxID=13093 RepID=UPI002550444D|nr:uncharacterized protein LOC130657426 [Hydractinia symbiolongicarpus]